MRICYKNHIENNLTSSPASCQEEIDGNNAQTCDTMKL